VTCALTFCLLFFHIANVAITDDFTCEVKSQLGDQLLLFCFIFCLFYSDPPVKRFYSLTNPLLTYRSLNYTSFRFTGLKDFTF
jgi:hypothetical protein